MIRALVLSTLALTLVAPVAKADDASARQLLQKAQELFAKRGEGDKLRNATDAVETLKQAEAQVTNDMELKYDILVLASRSLYWQGQHTDGDENKKVIHLDGKKKGDQAAALDDSYAEGHYFAGINLARWAEANGILASIQRKGELIEYMKKSSDLTRTTRDGNDGESVDGNGPDRVLGRMYQKLPGVLGGDHDLAVRMLRKAVARAPGNALNVVYLADSLMKGNNAEKAEGRQIATALVAQKPEDYGAAMDRVPETIEEFQLARDLLNGRPVP